MFKKMLLAGLFAFLASTGVFAADALWMSLNFYSEEGKVTPVGEFPAGVTMAKPIKFAAKTNLKGHAWPVRIELDQAPSVELQFKIEGSGVLAVSVNPIIWENGKIVSRKKVKCTDFVLNGKPTKKLPFIFDKWVHAAEKINVADGDTVTIKATFEKVEE